MIVAFLQINGIIRHHRNLSDLKLFGLVDSLCCHGDELIQDHHLLRTILKPQQEPLLNRDLFYEPSKIFPLLPDKSFPYLLV